MTNARPEGSPPIWELYADAEIDYDSRAAYEGWRVRELRLPKCASCHRWHAPPRSVCPFCWSFDVVPTPVSGRGRIHLKMLLAQGPERRGVRYPYPIVTVELEEQAALRFTSTIVDCAPSDICFDMPVELAWIDREGAPFPVFRPRKTAEAAQ